MRWFKKKEPSIVEIAGKGDLPAVVALLKSGVAPDAAGPESDITALWIAAGNGHDAVVKGLLAAGASADAKDPKKGVTALMIAALKGNGDVVLTLLNAGADANAQTYDGETALMFAVKGLSFNPRSEPHARLQRVIVKTLLTFGADPKKRKEFGGSVLDEPGLDEETKHLIESFSA